MFCLQRSKDITVESDRQSHETVDSVTGRFPFAIQHLLGIDAARHHHHHHHHHHHDVSLFAPQQHQSSLSSDFPTTSQPTTTDDVTYSAWTCPPSATHVTSSDVTPTAWYQGTDAVTLDDVIGSVNVRRQSSLPTLASHRRLAAASLTCLPSPPSVLPALVPSPTSVLPALADNVSGKLHSHTHTHTHTHTKITKYHHCHKKLGASYARMIHPSVCGSVRSSYRQKCSISYRPITLVGSSRMRATLAGRVCASLYCTFTPLSPTAHIAQWQDAPVVSSKFESRGGIITFCLFYLLSFLFTLFSFMATIF